MPNGQEDLVGFWPDCFDVYVWGSGADTILYGANFGIGAPSGPSEWHMHSLGTVDPLGQFDLVNTGALSGSQIEDVWVYSEFGVGLPQDMGSALLLYNDFVAEPEGFALMGVIPNEFVTDGGTTPTIHSYGVQPLPEPSVILLLAVAGTLLCRRRRHAG